jgi:DNA-binding MarR family transcriptional regulator
MPSLTLSGTAPDAAVPDPLSAQVHEAFMRLVHRQRRLLHGVLARHELHPAQAMCLRVLAHRDEVAQRDLAESLLLSKPSVTRMLQRLERAELVERRVDEQDQRQSVVRLTPAGHALAEHVHGALGEYLERSLARLPEADRRDLARLLVAWCDAADAAYPAAAETATEPASAEPASTEPASAEPAGDA